MDKITLERINEAHPKIRTILKEKYIEANNKLGKGCRLRFSYVYRSPEEQHAIFLQRPKVSNADSWQSIHNYALAFDIVLLYDKDGDGNVLIYTTSPVFELSQGFFIPLDGALLFYDEALTLPVTDLGSFTIAFTWCRFGYVTESNEFYYTFCP